MRENKNEKKRKGRRVKGEMEESREMVESVSFFWFTILTSERER